MQVLSFDALVMQKREQASLVQSARALLTAVLDPVHKKRSTPLTFPTPPHTFSHTLPHLNDCVLRLCMATVKPKPCRILEARDSALEPEMALIFSYTSFRRCWASSTSKSGSSAAALSGSCIGDAQREENGCKWKQALVTGASRLQCRCHPFPLLSLPNAHSPQTLICLSLW